MINVLENYTSEIVTSFKVNRDKSLIEGVAIITTVSANGRYYPKEVLQESISKFEGKPAYLTHAEDISNRDIRTMLGNFNNIHWNDNIAGLTGDLTVLEAHKSYLMDIAEKMPQTCGFSVSIDIATEEKDNKTIVTKIEKVYSIDLVSIPAATKNLTEGFKINNKEKGQVTEDTFNKNNKYTTEDNVMKDKEQAIIIKGAKPMKEVKEDVSKENVVKEDIAREDRLMKVYTEKINELETKNKTLESELKVMKTREKVQESLNKLQKDSLSKEFSDICLEIGDSALVDKLVHERNMFFDKKQQASYEVIGVASEENIKDTIKKSLEF